MYKVKYKVKLKVLTPFNIDNGEDRNDFMNKYTVRFNGKPYIPGTTIKGKVKDNFYMITDLQHAGKECHCPMCKIFGQAGYHPSQIYIDDFITEEAANVGVRVGIAIDRYRKVSKEGALFTKEIVHNKEFTGEVVAYLDHESIKYKEQLEIAFKMIDSIGNEKSRGQGKVEIQIAEVKE